MKKQLKKITALFISSVLLLSGCSCGGQGTDITDQDPTASVPSEAITSDTLTESDITSAGTSGSDQTSSVTSSPSDSSGTALTETAPPQNNPAAPQDPVVTTKKTENVPQTNPVSGSFGTKWNSPNTWEENGKYCGSCELTITNNNGTAVSGWSAKITVPNGFEITSSWNGNFSINGTTLTISNVEYNADIAAGSNISFGFNYRSPSKFTPPGNVVVNGKPSSNNGGSNGGNNNNNPPATLAPQPVKPLPAPAVIGLVKDHGKLSVKGTQLVDKYGKNFQLKGMSTHGLQWFPGFVNESAFKTLRDDWNTNVIRLAMYTAEGGYCEGNKEKLKALIDDGVQAATKLGMYVIIDWHILHDNNPQINKAEAKAFFEEMSSKYKNYDNVIYEICNEPNGGADWDRDIKPYAEEIISVIRKNSPDSVIIVGTPTWSQDIDKAAANPLKEKNVLYALHFYAATHTDWLRQRLTACYNKGLPVFVSEFGCCDASGNGGNDFGQTKLWLDLLDKYGISYINWNLANKNESSSAFKESASTNGNWSANDLSQSGAWMRKWFRGEG